MEWEKVLPLVLLHLMPQSIEKGDFPKKTRDICGT